MTWVDWWTQGVVLVSMTIAWAFVIRYGLWSPWRLTIVGRSLMYVWVSLAVVLTMITASFWLGEYPGRMWVRLVVYSSMPVAFAIFFRVLVHVQRGRLRGEIPSRVEADI